MLQSLLAVILVVGLLAREGGTQPESVCYSLPNCMGNIVAEGLTPRECCAGTDEGQSYSSDGVVCNVPQCIVHGFASASYVVTEDANLATTFSLNVKGETALLGAVTGEITSRAGGTSRSTDFFNILTVMVEVEGSDEAMIELRTRNDDITLEYNDTVILSFTPDEDDLIDFYEEEGEYIRDSVVVRIDDNDQLEINFDLLGYSFTEGEPGAQDIKVQFKRTQNPFTLILYPVSHTDAIQRFNVENFVGDPPVDEVDRATSGADFSSEHFVVTISPSEDSDAPSDFIIPQGFNITDDAIDEVVQSFVLVGEIGIDVPERFTCFQSEEGETGCNANLEPTARFGATRIQINDNDEMIIGFTQRKQTVSEAEGNIGPIPVQSFLITVDVTSMVISEIDYNVTFEAPASNMGRTAKVADNQAANILDYDALFGNFNASTGDLEDLRLLFSGSTTLSTPLTLTIVNDFNPEPEECFTIDVASPDVEGDRDIYRCFNDEENKDTHFCLHTICIEDDDEPFVVAFVETMYTVIESEGPVEVCVNLTRPPMDILDETVRVNVFNNESSVYIPDGAVIATPDVFDRRTGMYPMAPLTDYQEQTRSRNIIRNELINATRRIVCYDQPIYNDERLELMEYAGLQLDVREATVDLVLVKERYDNAAILIVDDDMAVVGLEQTFFSVSEDVGVVELCARVYEPDIVCPIAFPFDVRLFTRDDTAENPMDYLELNTILSFAACETRRCANVTIVNDMVDEPDPIEFFHYTLGRTIGLDPRISLAPIDGVVEIIDDDVLITVGYEFTSYTTSEGQGYVELSVIIFDPLSGGPLPGGALRPFTLSVNTEDGTAMSPGDYTAVVNELLQFNVGDVRVRHNITINQDDVCENAPNEFFFSDLALVSGARPINLIRPRAEVIINDDLESECLDIVVGYEFTVYTSDGEGTAVEICARIYEPSTGGTPREFVVSSTTRDGTAIAGEDYVGQTVNLLFMRGSLRECHFVTILDDEFCELPPTHFFADLALVSGRRVDINIDTTRIVIDDSGEDECEPIVVGYEFPEYTTSESDGSVELCAVIRRPVTGSPRPFVLMTNSEDGVAIAGEDYNAIVNQQVVVTVPQTSACYRVVIRQDSICEIDPEPIEDFYANLTYFSGIMPIFIDLPRTRVIIDDTNEPECVPIEIGYERTVYTTTEGNGIVELCAVVFDPPGGSPRDIVISATTRDGTAVAGEDYVAVIGEPLRFPLGTVRVCHNITILQDSECEILPENEFFYSDLSRESGVGDIIIRPPTAQVIIDDTAEPECVHIRVGYEMTLYSTSEGDISVELCAIIYEPIAGVAPRPFVLSYRTEDGTAMAPGDYISDSGLLMFETGDDRQCHTVQIVDDNVCEDIQMIIEYFFSNLALVSGIPPITVDPDRAQVNIDDSADCIIVLVNDTLTGDPLMTVPIFTDPFVRPGDGFSSLCYEVHGAANAFFNLITDECTSVNAYYQHAVTPSPNIDLNVVTQIGVRTVGNTACWNIQVDLNMCRVTVNGSIQVVTSTEFDGISVKRYNGRRVRISVPNCDDTMLVMWVMCRNGSVEDPVTWEYFNVNFIRFVVTRGLNLNERSHGLMGQFWNVPVTVEPFNGMFGGVMRDDDYIITVSHPEADPRSFVGLRSDITWEFEKRVCYYVGNTQAGELAEVTEPNDSVIEGEYSEYRVESLFATEFTYKHFDEGHCT